MLCNRSTRVHRRVEDPYSGRCARTRRAASRLVPPFVLRAIAARGACSRIRLITASKNSSNGSGFHMPPPTTTQSYCSSAIPSTDARVQPSRLTGPSIDRRSDWNPQTARVRTAVQHERRRHRRQGRRRDPSRRSRRAARALLVRPPQRAPSRRGAQSSRPDSSGRAVVSRGLLRLGRPLRRSGRGGSHLEETESVRPVSDCNCASAGRKRLACRSDSEPEPGRDPGGSTRPWTATRAPRQRV